MITVFVYFKKHHWCKLQYT